MGDDLTLDFQVDFQVDSEHRDGLLLALEQACPRGVVEWLVTPSPNGHYGVSLFGDSEAALNAARDAVLHAFPAA